MRQTDKLQIQLTVINSHGTETYCDDCGRLYSALGGRGIIATALPILSTTTAPNFRIGFDIILLNNMAPLLSIYDTERSEDGIAVIELVGLCFSIYVTMCITSS